METYISHCIDHLSKINVVQKNRLSFKPGNIQVVKIHLLPYALDPLSVTQFGQTWTHSPTQTKNYRLESVGFLYGVKGVWNVCERCLDRVTLFRGISLSRSNFSIDLTNVLLIICYWMCQVSNSNIENVFDDPATPSGMACIIYSI